MTREEAKELIPIVQAYADGKIIQAKWRSESGDKWEDMPEINSFMEDLEYRIKPEPRESWVIHATRSHEQVDDGFVFLDEARARTFAQRNGFSADSIARVREVL